MGIPFHKTAMSEAEIQAVVDTMRSGWITIGPQTKEFEDLFAKAVGAKYAVAVNSATAGLHLALKALGIQAGDEVILPTTTFVATAEVVTYFNATPVLCDIREDTHSIDPKKIEALISPKTKAIIPVHFSGAPADMDEINAIAAKQQIPLIQDAAHSFPSEYKGAVIGSTGTAVFSFYATKTLSTGEGGMVCTDDEALAKSVQCNRLHGMSRDAWNRYAKGGTWQYDVIDNGCKYNMTDIQAALGKVQLKRAADLTAKRKSIHERYDAAFSEFSTLSLLEDRESSYHLYVIKVANRDALIQALADADIGSSVHFIPIHKFTYYKETYQYNDADYPVANRVFEQCLSLPIFPDMSDDEVDQVIQVVKANAEPLS